MGQEGRDQRIQENDTDSKTERDHWAEEEEGGEDKKKANENEGHSVQKFSPGWL